jgi:hypothetical protein
MKNNKYNLTATLKHPEIELLLANLTGVDRVKSIETGTCVSCGGDVLKTAFRDPLSFKEFTISGLCQPCQDEVFGISEE